MKKVIMLTMLCAGSMTRLMYSGTCSLSSSSSSSSSSSASSVKSSVSAKIWGTNITNDLLDTYIERVEAYQGQEMGTGFLIPYRLVFEPRALESFKKSAIEAQLDVGKIKQLEEAVKKAKARKKTS